MERQKLLTLLLILIYVIVIIHGAAEWFYLYWLFPWFDIMMHFLGGVWVGLAVLWLVYYSGYVPVPRKTKSFAFMLCLGLVGVVGLAWEAYEFITRILLHAPLFPDYAADTTLDMIMDLLGAIVGFWIFSGIAPFAATPQVQTTAQ